MICFCFKALVPALVFSVFSSAAAFAEPVEIANMVEAKPPEQAIESVDAAPVQPEKKLPTQKERSAGKSGKVEQGSHPYHALIQRHAAANNVPFFLANSMIRIESRYNPNARSGPNLGLGQISVSTAKSLGYAGSAQGLMHPETNLTYSIKYLAQAYKMASGDTCGTVMRYQNGLRSTRMSAANRAYCAKVSSS